MSKSLFRGVCVALLLFLGVQEIHSQQSRVSERETEWNQYTLPQSTFIRQTDPSKTVLFRVPSEWEKQISDKVEFKGPHDTSLKVFVEKIPDGSPLRGYVSAVMQSLRGVSDDPDAIVVRATTISGLDAREIMFESDEGSAEVTRRIIWCTVRGPNAIGLVLITPLTKVSEIEPYFKAVVQSLTLLNEHDYTSFDELRTQTIKEAQPQRVDEVQSLVAALGTLGAPSRQASVAKLASMFVSSPDTAIDLTLDNRPMVRAAALEAIAQSRNSTLDKFLFRALDDQELFVAEKAARAVADNANIVQLTREQSFEWLRREPLVRVWPFLTRANQIKVIQDIFARPVMPAPPPPKPGTVETQAKTSVTVRAKVLPPGVPLPQVLVTDSSPTSSPHRYFTGLTLLRDLSPSEFKLPLGSILAAKNESLNLLALQVAWNRDEVLPTAELLKLLSSASFKIRRLAALSLGQSAGIADIKSIEMFAGKLVTGGESADAKEAQMLSDDLQLTITKIRLREAIASVSGEARRQLIQKNLTDPKLTEWVWYRYVRADADRSESAHSLSQAKVLPLGENLFPKDVTYFAALPHPQTALDKLSSAIDGLQLDSARSQANFVLILNFFREQLAQELETPGGARPLNYSGVDFNQPIALAKWFTDGAPEGIPDAQREVIILRVTDRTRFERVLTRFQQVFGDFGNLTEVFSGSVRFLPVVPAFLPIIAKAILEGAVTPTKTFPLFTYRFSGVSEWNGHSIKLVEQRKVDKDGVLTTDSAFLTYLGDTAILAPNRESLQEVLSIAMGGHTTIAENANFKQALETAGEAIYFSDLRQIAAEPGSDQSSKRETVTETGALRISNSVLENVYQMRFNESDWIKSFSGFQPEELSSPRDLLPRTTVAYYFMKFDGLGVWRDWSIHLFNPEKRKELLSVWALDFEQEVLPELGPECGVAILGIPNLKGDDWELPWLAFFKLKTDKLARALEAGKLFTAESTGTGAIRVKLKSGDLFVAVKAGFLVLSTNQKGFAALDQKEKLIASRDFSRAAKRAPENLVAFGGYNLEDANASLGDPGTDAVKTQQSSLVSSLANAFHSPNFYATATADAVHARLSLSMDREGRFSVSELASLSKEYRLTFAELEARGVPIENQERLSSLKLRVRAAAAGEIDRLKEDISSPHQTVEQSSATELVLRILPRNSTPRNSVLLPVKDPQFNQYLQPSGEIRSDDKTVIDKAREIVGEERDAWNVARKLAQWTYKNITWKRVDYATAPQTLATLEADCLEFSQLYVAMARSLGLPARIVSGLAYSGGSFGGHAWVEVHVGDWIEVDPTWGTDFVDATHIRNSSNGTLLTYASLNLIELEVLEAHRGVTEFQKNVGQLAEKLCQELAQGGSVALTSALDLSVLTNEHPGLGGWQSLNDSERAAMASAYRRLMLSINNEFSKATTGVGELRLLKVKESGDTGEAIAFHPGFGELLIKIKFIKRNDAWYLSEIVQTDTGFQLVSESLLPTMRTIIDGRNNKAAPRQTGSDFLRTLVVMQKDAKASLNIAERLLQNDPRNQSLRHLKALALVRDSRQAEAIELWKELAGEEKPFAPAVLNLAWQYDDSEDAAKSKLAIEFFNRYAELEPEDPRPQVALARLYDDAKDDVRAEAAHRGALQRDPSNTRQYVAFASFLAIRKRFNELDSVIAAAEKKAGPEDDLFGDLMADLYFTDDKTLTEALARNQPQRMAKSAEANLYLAYARLENGKSAQSIPLLSKAIALNGEWAEPYVAMARAYRALRNWKAALVSAETAIRMYPESSEAHFQRACTLSRLGRLKEALKSLEKSIELDPDQVETIKEEADLKILASRPAFKKLLAGLESQK